MEEAIGRMSEGEKALFIIPSQIGFGERAESWELECLERLGVRIGLCESHVVDVAATAG